MGLDQGFTLPKVTEEVLAAQVAGEDFSALLHAGDIGFNIWYLVFDIVSDFRLNHE